MKNNFSETVDQLFQPWVEKYHLEMAGTEGVRTLKNKYIEIRISNDRFDVSASCMLPGKEIGLPLTTLVKNHGGDPGSFLPDPQVPVTDLDAQHRKKLEGFKQMLETHLKSALSGPDPWFQDQMAEAEYEYKVKDYVFKHAPMDHPARRALRAPFWKEEAEKFLQEQGVTIQ